jgi:opacity protein-like surface antigen
MMSRFYLLPLAGWLLTTQAHAADYYMPPPPMAAPPPALAQQPPPAHYWSGCYTGFSAGITNTDTTFEPATNTNVGYTDTLRGTISLHRLSPTVGLSLGCDANFNNFVIGGVIEGNYTPTTTKGITGYIDPYVNQVKMDNPFNVDLSLRAGRIFDTTLVYVKAGVMVTMFSYKGYYSALSMDSAPTYTINSAGQPTNSYLPEEHIVTISSSKNNWAYGPLIGLGAEHMLNANWSVLGEVSTAYMPQATSKLTLDEISWGGMCKPGQGGTVLRACVWGNNNVGDTWSQTTKSFISNVRIGVNYHF